MRFEWDEHRRVSHLSKHGYAEGTKARIRRRIDPDLLAWFKRQGPGYQTRINAALRAFVEAHERERAS